MIYDNILILCGVHGISIARLERETDLGNGTIRNWKKSSPRTETLKRVADYFGVAVDCLLTQHKHTTNLVQ